jgi:hypothetical protein
MPIYTPGKLVLKKDSVATDPNFDPNFANVSLLLYGDGTNGSTTITDSSPSPKTVTAFGNAQISTAQNKFGGSSIAFDGNGDYIECASNADFAFGTGQYTVEFWLRFVTVTDVNEFVSTSTDVSFGRWTIYYNGGTFFTGATGGAGGTTFGFTPSASVWYFLTVTRDASNNQRLFIDGDLKNTTTSTNNYTQSGFWAGRSLAASPTYLNGYIDDLRITKGVARYTANFTPPQNQLPNY